MRRFQFSFLLLPLFALHATAQKTTSVAPISATTAPATQITLGNATVPLTGPWKFHIGDDMAWAGPDFDDSAWGTMDLTPPPGSYDPVLGSSGYLPGWTARGYRDYSGYAWYRLRVDIQDGQTQLSLKMPDDVDDAYQVYVNGKRIGEFGQFTARSVAVYFTQPRAFLLPENFRGGPATIAIRMWMTAYTPLVDPDAGGLHGPPVLGQASAISGLLQLDWDVVDRGNYSPIFQSAILLLALLVAFGLFWLDRKEPAYFWLGLACAAMLSLAVVNMVGNYTLWMGGNTFFLLEDAVLTPASIGLWVLFWAYWFRLGAMARWHRMVWGLVLALVIATAMLRAPLYGSLVPVHASVWLSPLAVALKLLLGILLVWATVLGIRKDRAEGLLALPAVLLVILSRYSEELGVLHVPTAVYPFGVGIGVNTAAIVLSLAIITVLLVRRFLRGQHEREQFRQEMEQAKQVQQVLIPEALPVIPGFTLESEYLPARQVGGDFFQIIAHPSDGSVLIVVGDVAGKGLQAGMLVALIVGAIRNQTDTNFDPLRMLQSLNRRLLGRGQAHATCLSLRIAADGAVTLANAGHLPPYLNGKELPMEGAMLLGMIEGAEFSTMRFQLEPGDTLMLMSDGVAEAKDEQGQLFGFERVQAMLRKPITAAEMATAAQNFGQEDDILVLRVERDAATEARPHTEPAMTVG